MDGRVDTGWDASKFEANPEPAPEAPFPLSDFQPDYTLPTAPLAEPPERSLGKIEPKQKFGEAFARARGAGLKVFEWGGKSYSTETREEAATRVGGKAKPVSDKPAAAPADDGWSLAAFGVQEPSAVDAPGALYSPKTTQERVEAARRAVPVPELTKERGFKAAAKQYMHDVNRAASEEFVSARAEALLREQPYLKPETAKALAVREAMGGGKADIIEDRDMATQRGIEAGRRQEDMGIGDAIMSGTRKLTNAAKITGSYALGTKALAGAISDAMKSGPQDLSATAFGAQLQDVGSSMTLDKSAREKLGGFVDIGNAILSNPKGFTHFISEQAPNFAAMTAGNLIGWVTGGPAGARAGQAVSEFPLEFGSQLQDRVGKSLNGREATRENVLAALNENPNIVRQALTKAIGTTFIDSVTTVAGQKVAADVAAASAVKARRALGNEASASDIASFVVRDLARNPMTMTKAVGKGMAVDTTGAAASEIIPQKVAYGEVDAADVIGETLLEPVFGSVGIAGAAVAAGRQAATTNFDADVMAGLLDNSIRGAEFAPLPDAGIGQDGPGQADYEAAMRQAFGGATQPGATTAPDAVSLAPTQVAPPPPSGPVTAALQEAMPTMPPAAAEQPWRNQSFSDLLAQDAADPLVRPENMLPVEDAEPMPEMPAASADQDWAPMPAMPSMPDGQEWTPMPASPEMAEDQPLETNDIEWENQLPVDAAENAEPESGIFSDQSQADAEPQDDWLNRFISEDTGTEEAASDPVFSAAFNDLPDEPGLIANQEADAPPESSVEPGVMAEAPHDNIATDDTAPAESEVFVSGVDGFDDDELLRQAEAAATNDKGDPDASTEMAAFGREGQSDQPQGSQADRGTGGRSESTAGDRHAGRTESSVGPAVSVGDALPGSAALAEEAVYPAEEATIEAQEMGGDTQTRSGYSVFSPSITSISVNQETDGIGSGDTTIINQFDPVDEKREIGDIATLPTTNTEAATTLEAALRGTGNPAIDLAANAAASSPLNAVPEPTEAQKKAGNYAVGRVRLHGMDISIENPAGSIRSGTDSDGERWETEMQSHYGYIRNSTGRDKDHIDVFLSQGADTARTAWVIDQINQDGTFDEHKIVIGPDTEAEARDAYLANYDPGWMGLGAITPMAMDDFKTWVFDKKKTRKPVAYKKPSTRLTAHDDPRIAQYADTLRELASQTGWAQTGGRIYRNPDTGEVDGRTAWIPNAEWYPNLSERLSGGDAVSAVEAAISGASMSVRQKRFVSDLLDVAESYANVDTEDHDPDSAAEAAAERAAIQATEDLIVEMDDSDLDALIDAAWNAEPTERRELSDEEIDELFGAPSEEAPGTASAEGAVTVGQDEGDNRGSDSDWTTGDAEEVAFDLTGQTPEQAMAEEQAIADAKKAEQDAADKAEAEAKKARISAEVASRQQASAENFQLGQSAEDALSGQGDIFGGLTQQEATNEQQSIEQLREKLRKIEDKILLAAGERDNIEQAMSSRKVGKSLKDERNAIRDQVRTAQKRLDDAQKQTATSTETPAGQPDATTAQPAQSKPESVYGTTNTLVTKDRAAELRAKLKSKLGQVNSGIDPEILAIGAELAAYHIEAGARSFGRFAQVMAEDLGASFEKLRPYLRSWFNGARDMLAGRTVLSRQSTGGMALRDLKAVAARVQRANKNMPTLHVLASPENLDRNDETQKRLYDFLVKNDALKDVEGATHEGEIYVFASGVADEFRAEHILAIHEPTHYGLRSVYGHELDSVLQLIYASNATVRQKADALIRSDVDSNVGAVEEVLADMTPAELVKLRGWRRLVRTLRDWFREHGFTAIANRLDGWLKSGLTDQAKADLYVADVVNAAREWVKNGKRMGFAADGTNLQRVWHGTPHTFMPEPGFPHGRPRLDKMGTGEGAQAFGWGFYTATEKDIGVGYKNRLTADIMKRQRDAASAVAAAKWYTHPKLVVNGKTYYDRMELQGDIASDRLGSMDMPDGVRKAFVDKLLEEEAGSLYQLDIPDDVLPYLLDWDKPLSEQTKEVQDALRKAMSEKLGYGKLNDGDEKAIGSRIYQGLSDRFGAKAASEYLASLGIVGNRYLDGQSRNRPLKDIKREFLSELPEDADTGEVAELIGTGKFSPKNDALLRALVADDWLGFDYPAQAVSAALSKDLSGYDASPELIRTVEDAKEGGTYNYVIWDQPTLDRIALLERNGERLDAMREADAPLSMDQDRGPGADLTKQPTMPGSEFIKGADGKPLAVWHGSGEAFDTFKFTDDIGFHFGSKEAAQERLDQTGQSGVVRSFKLRLSNPLKLKHDPGEWKIREFVSALPDNVVDAISEKINNAEDEYIDGAGELSDWLGENRKDHEYLRNEIIELGYDGIAYRNSFEGGTSYVVFHDHQIESANDQPHLQQGNDSRFNRSGQSTGRDTSLSRSGQSTGAAPSLPSETVFRKLQRIGQDSMNRFTVIQDWLAEQGVADLPYGRMDVYRSEERMHGKIASRIEDFREKRLTPLIKRIHKAGFEMDQVAEYLHANHAIERNEQIERINKAAVDVNGDRNGSGMTDAEAAAVLSTYQALPNFSEFEALAEEVRSITDSTKRILLGAGIISQDQADAWDAAYKHYVPLRGNDEGGTASGKGLSVNAKSEHKRAMGHGDRESGEWIVENIIHAHERAIYLAEKNVVGKHLLTLAASVPNADLWTVSKPAKRGVIMPGQVAFAVAYKGNVVASFNTKAEAESFVNQSVMSNTARAKSNYTVNRTVGDPQVVYMASGQLADNEVQVYVKGHAVRIQLIDPLLANAYKRLGQENLTGIMALGRDINNFLSRAYTGLAPEFIVTNVQRDLLSGMVNILGEEGATVAARSLKNWPEAMYRMSRFSVTGNGDPWFNSYRESGGSTGGAYIGDLDRIGREVQATYDEAIGVFRMFRENRTGKASLLAAKKLLHAFTFWIEHMNAAAEGGMRLAAYRAKIETEAKRLGVTADVLRDEKSLRATVARNRAASLAKNSTVNFNRKGEKGAEINANFLFYNAAVQGSAIMAHALVKGKRKGQAWTALATLTGLAALLASQFGDDEWEEIPQHEKDRNMLIKLGDTGYVAKYSVPYGHGLAFAMGNSLHDLSQGKAAGAVGYHMASAVFENLMPRNPLGEDAKSLEDYGWTNFVPEGAFLGVKWWSNIGINRDGFGRQIMPESKYDETQPDHLKMYSTLQGSIYDKITSSTNKATGGTDTQAGSVDVSPETLQFLFESITGGLGRFAVDEANVAKLAAQGSAPEVKEVPVVRKFARERNRASDARSEFWETLGQAEDYIANRKRAVDGHDSAALENMERGHAELSKWVNTYKDDATAIRDDINEKRNDDTLSAAKKREAIREIETSSVDTFRKMRHRLDDEMDLLKE